MDSTAELRAAFMARIKWQHGDIEIIADKTQDDGKKPNDPQREPSDNPERRKQIGASP